MADLIEQIAGRRKQFGLSDILQLARMQQAQEPDQASILAHARENRLQTQYDDAAPQRAATLRNTELDTESKEARNLRERNQAREADELSAMISGLPRGQLDGETIALVQGQVEEALQANAITKGQADVLLEQYEQVDPEYARNAVARFQMKKALADNGQEVVFTAGEDRINQLEMRKKYGADVAPVTPADSAQVAVDEASVQEQAATMQRNSEVRQAAQDVMGFQDIFRLPLHLQNDVAKATGYDTQLKDYRDAEQNQEWAAKYGMFADPMVRRMAATHDDQLDQAIKERRDAVKAYDPEQSPHLYDELTEKEYKRQVKMGKEAIEASTDDKEERAEKINAFMASFATVDQTRLGYLKEGAQYFKVKEGIDIGSEIALANDRYDRALLARTQFFLKAEQEIIRNKINDIEMGTGLGEP